jgi:beta-ketodecanoyl-[acyl-carrier-protein] synthase
MHKVVISGTGLYTPPNSISNAELVESFNGYVELFNQENAADIAAGNVTALEPSSVGFIEKASGIQSRHVIDKQGILDIHRMAPHIPERSDDEPSIMCEMAVTAAKQALERAGKTAADIDAVICAASNMQRPYPAMAVEIQNALGIDGYGYDINVACSSATFGIQAAMSAIQSGQARAVLVVNPEITSGHLNWRDRDSHFIFGDACTAIVLERADLANSASQFEILAVQLKTQFSNNIRNNFGFLNRADESGIGKADKLFRQQGRKVFKDVCPMAAATITSTVQNAGLAIENIKRFWLHQANLNMNLLIARLILGRDASAEESPTILDTYANTSSAGSVIAFHQYNEDFSANDIGILCSFGAGYSIGCVVLKKVL